MGMKRTSILKDVPTTSSSGTNLPAIPAIPEVPAIPAKKTVQPLEQKERAGDDRLLATVDEPRPKVLSDYQKPWLPAEVRRNDRRDILVNTLLSPSLAQRIIGLNQAEAFKEFEAWFDKAVQVFYSK